MITDVFEWKQVRASSGKRVRQWIATGTHPADGVCATVSIKPDYTIGKRSPKLETSSKKQSFSSGSNLEKNGVHGHPAAIQPGFYKGGETESDPAREAYFPADMVSTNRGGASRCNCEVAKQ